MPSLALKKAASNPSAMQRIQGFAPIEDKNAKVLILGSMPGQASLAAGQYYAHRQNTFWRIISELLHVDAAAPYEVKAEALKSAKIALWDVLKSCMREGSLDAMIARDTHIINDFQAFLHTHQKITHIFFNGAKAEEYFMRHVLKNINHNAISFRRLPSTSPAHASMSFAQKLAAWRAIIAPAVVAS